MIIKQGDAYGLPVSIEANGQEITEDTLYLIDTVEIYLEDNFKEYKKGGGGEVTFAEGMFWYPMSQEESQKLTEGPGKVDIRVKTIDGEVHGLPYPLRVTIADARSRRVL